MKRGRSLTDGEVGLSRTIFGEAIAYEDVQVVRAKWAFFQPCGTVMAPMGAIHFHPNDPSWRDDFSSATLRLQRLFIHEMTHVWQAQVKGRWWLPLMRHPFCRYRYRFVPGRPFTNYGIEQQAEMVADLFLMTRGTHQIGLPGPDDFARIFPFNPD